MQAPTTLTDQLAHQGHRQPSRQAAAQSDYRAVGDATHCAAEVDQLVGIQMKRHDLLRLCGLAGGRSGAAAVGYWAVMPPSAVTVEPVRNEASSPARNNATRAISSGVPSRPI